MPDKNPHAVALGKMGGSKGGKEKSRQVDPRGEECQCEEGRPGQMGQTEKREGIIVILAN